MPDDKQAYTGHRVVTSGGSDHNLRRLQIEGVHDERRTTVPVKIIAIHGGGVGPAPTADVQPLIDQVDGLGNRTPHAPSYNVPVSRNHSGNGAIISDPVAGDIMIMSVADRDISTLKKTGQQSAPGSKRRGSLSDGIIHHAMLSGTPDQYVFFKPEGGFVVADRAGNVVETFKDAKMMTLTVPAGGIVALGGNPSKGGTFDFVQTVSGPSTVVKAKL